MTTEADTPRFLTVNEVAEILRVNPRTVTRLVQNGELAHFRWHHSVRITPADLEAFLAAAAHPAEKHPA